jgi:putative iron-dependent peroxidase
MARPSIETTAMSARPEPLFFIAYCRTPDIPEQMLARMMGMSGDGLADRLMEFSRAVSGAHFFAPSLPTLAAFGRA